MSIHPQTTKATSSPWLSRLRRIRLVAAGICILLLLSSALPVVAALPISREGQRQAAMTRWEARPFSNYRIGVQVQWARRFCFQEVEVRGNGNGNGSSSRLLNDTCHVSWLPSFSVDRLFDLSGRLVHGPECQPSVQDCTCRRLQTGHIAYDAQFGYPVSLSMRREVRPNWWYIDYWRRVGSTKVLPTCNWVSQPFGVTIVSFTPLP